MFELTEGLVDGQVGLDDEHGSSGCLGLLEDVTTTSVQDSVDSTDCVLRALKVLHDKRLIMYKGLTFISSGVYNSFFIAFVALKKKFLKLGSRF